MGWYIPLINPWHTHDLRVSPWIKAKAHASTENPSRAGEIRTANKASDVSMPTPAWLRIHGINTIYIYVYIACVYIDIYYGILNIYIYYDMLNIYMCVCSCAYPSLWLHLSIDLSMYLSVYLSIHLYIYLCNFSTVSTYLSMQTIRLF